MKQFKDAPSIKKAYNENYITYGEYYREDWKNEVIRSQIRDLERNLFREKILVDDPSNPNKLLIQNFKLPKEIRRLNNGRETVPLYIILPDDYPDSPPVGFYLPKEIYAGAHGGFARGYHGAYGCNEYESDDMEERGFRWYCSSIIPSTWSPAKIRYIEDWRKGDNLWHVVTLISEVLSDLSDD